MQATDVLELLGIEISPARMKCAMLSLETLQGGVGARAGTRRLPRRRESGMTAGPSDSWPLQVSRRPDAG